MFVPANVEWFIAIQIEEFFVQGQSQNLVYSNSILVRAKSAEIAYARAIELCERSNQQYLNSDGDLVTCRFRGIYDLFPIHDDLEDGAELSYVSLESLNETELLKLIKTKEELELFRSSNT